MIGKSGGSFMATVDAKPEVDSAAPEMDGKRSLHAQVSEGMLQAAGRWMKEHGDPDVYAARMAMWQRIHDALPPREFKEFHEKGRGLAELDAKVAGWSGRGKDLVWTLAKDVIAADFPPVLLLPNNTPSIIDALAAQTSGYLGEAAVKGGVAAYEGAKGAIGTVRNRIDSAMTFIISGSAMRAAPAGGAA